MKLEYGYSDRNTILNMKLSKMLGLYQILDPNGPKLFGYNISHIIVTFFIILESILLLFNLIGIYYWMKNPTQVSFQFALFTNFSFSCIKMAILIRKTSKIRKCIDVACNDFLKFKNYKKNYFDNFRSKSILITNIIASMGFIILTVFVAVPIIFNKNFIFLKTLDGKVHSYHLSSFNIFFPVTSNTYNRYFEIIYIFEFLFGSIYVVFSHSFDSFMISMCFAMRCQLKTINKAFSTFGKNYSTNHNSNRPRIAENNMIILNNLKLLINDQQKVLKKMKAFYIIIRSIIITKLVIISQSIIFLSFIITLNLYLGRVEGETLKIFAAFSFCLMELFLVCYLFQSLNTEIDEMNFALYCSNWEDMDMECKKLILLAMIMNNAHKVYMKITITKNVNMELFASTIRWCYSVLSVMVNSNLKESKTV